MCITESERSHRFVFSTNLQRWVKTLISSPPFPSLQNPSPSSSNGHFRFFYLQVSLETPCTKGAPPEERRRLGGRRESNPPLYPEPLFWFLKKRSNRSANRRFPSPIYHPQALDLKRSAFDFDLFYEIFFFFSLWNSNSRRRFVRFYAVDRARALIRRTRGMCSPSGLSMLKVEWRDDRNRPFDCFRFRWIGLELLIRSSHLIWGSMSVAG